VKTITVAGSAIALAIIAATTAGGSAAPGRSFAADVPVRSDVRDLGRAAGSTTVNLALTLSYRNQAELDRLVELQGDPTSPMYLRFLDNAQFNAYFAPSATDYARSAAILIRAGFHVTNSFENRTILDVAAPVRTVERYFATEIHTVNQVGHGFRYANVRPATMPDELLPTVAAISGFDNLVTMKYDLQRGRPAPGNDLVSVDGAPLKGPDGGFGPVVTQIAYDFPARHKFDGKGRATGNAISGDIKDADVTAFIKFFGVTRTGPATSRVSVDGGAVYNPNSPDTQEAVLDAETIVGNAPGTHFYMYLFPDLSFVHVEDGYNKAVSDNVVDALNSSFGACETNNPFATATNKIAQQAAAKGITFNASSGDSGSSQCGTIHGGQNSPATGTYFTSVGGTSLTVSATGAYVSESAWSGSGGGVSTVFAIPTYQKGVKGLASQTKRNVPDVAFVGDPNTGASYYLKDLGGFVGPIGGTSLSSPLFSALITEIDQKDKARVGAVNTRLYKAFASKGYSVYRDITTGNNGGYLAHKGYDNVTGIGSARGFALGGVL